MVTANVYGANSPEAEDFAVMPFPAFTAVENQAIHDVLTHQLTFLPLPLPVTPSAAATEMHIAVDGTGTAVIDTVIHPAVGGHMTAIMQTAAAIEPGCRIIHNHPSQHSLSHSDWSVLAAHPLVEMTAVNSHGTTFRGKVLVLDAFSDWTATMIDLSVLIRNRLSLQIELWIAQGLWDVVDIAADEDWILDCAIGDRLQAKGYVLYKCVPGGGQVSAYTSPAATVFRAALDQFCKAEIP